MEIKYEDAYGNLLTTKIHSHTFSIDPSAIDQDLCSLGRIMIEYAEIESALKTEVERKENALIKLEADLDTALRIKSQSEGSKLTEKSLTSLVNSNESRLELLESLRLSKDNYNKIKWVMRTISSKKDALICIAYRDKELIRADRYN